MAAAFANLTSGKRGEEIIAFVIDQGVRAAAAHPFA